MTARTYTAVTCDHPRCTAKYVEYSAWAAHEAWLKGWTRRHRKRRLTRWADFCPDHSKEHQ